MVKHELAEKALLQILDDANVCKIINKSTKKIMNEWSSLIKKEKQKEEYDQYILTRIEELELVYKNLEVFAFSIQEKFVKAFDSKKYKFKIITIFIAETCECQRLRNRFDKKINKELKQGYKVFAEDVNDSYMAILFKKK